MSCVTGSSCTAVYVLPRTTQRILGSMHHPVTTTNNVVAVLGRTTSSELSSEHFEPLCLALLKTCDTSASGGLEYHNCYRQHLDTLSLYFIRNSVPYRVQLRV